MKFVNEAVPFQVNADGRRYLTEKQLTDDPYLQDFVKRFRHCFEYDVMTDCWFFIE
jgi:hypothetical protein